jgi:glycosyltransferase involved in cell wall biosynthesis
LAQTETSLEVMVVDDGSDDRTAAIVAAHPDPRVGVLTQPNAGPAAARNAGIRATGGEYVAVLDSDDLWLPTYLEAMGTALQRARHPGFAYTDAYAFDSMTGRVRRQSVMESLRPPRAQLDQPRFLLALLERNFVYVSVAVPRSVLHAVGGYDERRFGTEDYDLWLRISIAGYEAIPVSGRLCLYRLHPDQISHDSTRMYRELARMFTELDLDSLPTDAHREVALERRRQLGREVAIADGRAPLLSALRELRHVGGRARRRVGLGDRWYAEPPPVVAATLGTAADDSGSRSGTAV